MSGTDPITGAIPPIPSDPKHQKPQKEFPKVEKVKESDDRQKKRKNKQEEEVPTAQETVANAAASTKDSILNPIKPGAAAFKTSYSVSPAPTKPLRKPLGNAPPPAPEETPPPPPQNTPTAPAAPIPSENLINFLNLDEIQDEQAVNNAPATNTPVDTRKNQPTTTQRSSPKKTSKKDSAKGAKTATTKKPAVPKAPATKTAAVKDKSSDKQTPVEKKKADEPVLTGAKSPEGFTPLTPEQLKMPPPSPPPATAAGRLPPAVSELFEKMVGYISTLPSNQSGEPTTTTVLLTADSYRSSAFYGVKIILQEVKVSQTGPVQYKITLQGKPEQVKLLQQNSDKLLRAFDENFKNAQKAGLKLFQVKSIVVEPLKGDNKTMLFKRKSPIKDNKKGTK